MSAREDWPALRREEIIEPDLPICDAHHHLWDTPRQTYLLPDFLQDAGSGHAIESSVYVEAGAFYRKEGEEALKPVGETEFANGVASMAASGRYGQTRACEAIVGFADLMLGNGVEQILAEQQAAGNGRLRGIRQTASWDVSPRIVGGRFAAPPELYRNVSFRLGFERLKDLNLGFDAFVYHPQLGDVLDLARAYPEQEIVLDHAGGLLGIGPYAGRHEKIFGEWRDHIRELASCPNVTVKLGGLGMTRCGFGFHKLGEPIDSMRLAAAWRPWIETCIEAFGAERCMFESNFPVDKPSCSYAVLWNAFKRLAGGATDEEKHFLFRGTAARVYRLGAKNGLAQVGE